MKTRNTLNWIGMTIGVLYGVLFIVGAALNAREPDGLWLAVMGLFIAFLIILGRFWPVALSPPLIVLALLATEWSVGIPFCVGGNVQRDANWLSFVVIFGTAPMLCGALFLAGHEWRDGVRTSVILNRLGLAIGGLTGVMWTAFGVWGQLVRVPVENQRIEDAVILAFGVWILMLTLLTRFWPSLGSILFATLVVGSAVFWLYVPSLPPVPQSGTFAVISGLILWAIFSLPLAVTTVLFLNAARCARSPDVPAPIEHPIGG